MRTVLDHLWQSTVFLLLAALLVMALRDNSAHIRFRLWFAASLKFLLPFGALATLGRYLPKPPLPALPAQAALLAQPATETFAVTKSSPMVSATIAAPAFDWTLLLLAVWSAGFLAVVTRWAIRWIRLRAVLRDAASMSLASPLPVKTAPSLIEPGLVGIWKPLILLPDGIADRVSAEELDAILAHELCHWRRHDNLMAAIHMLVEAMFWFFPPVWWLGARLNDERERACDEMVLALGTTASVYAQSILTVCKHYLETPLPCAAGISGADLKSRLGRIAQNRPILKLSRARKALLVLTGTVAVAAPILAGVAMAEPVDSLDGWDQFKFGMTPAHVRALPAPGKTWWTSPPVQLGVASLTSGGPVEIFGTKFRDVNLSFMDNKLDYISMMAFNEHTTSEQCKRSFEELIANMEAHYGAFGPGYRAVQGATVRPVGTKSQYQYAADPEDGPDTFWEDARLVRNGHYLDIRHSHRTFRGNQGCMTGITFTPHSPQGPNPPAYSRT